MNILYLNKLIEFSKEHANSRKSLASWKIVVAKAIWNTKQDVLADFPNAKMINNNRARFEINHNTYRMIVFINYDAQAVVIRFIGTHTEYDRIDPEVI